MKPVKPNELGPGQSIGDCYFSKTGYAVREKSEDGKHQYCTCRAAEAPASEKRDGAE